jgi:hypothetical protein
MDFEELLAILSWREALIAMVVLLAIYLLVVFLRYSRLKRERLLFVPPASPVSSSAIAAYTSVQDPEPVISTESLDLSKSASTGKTEEFDFPWNEPPRGVNGQQVIEALESEVAQLRKEVGGLRAEILVLREEQRREPAKPPVTQHVSPLYSDAMQMAMQGNDAASISQYCGISRAEAELVVALVRNGDNEQR